MAMVSLNRARVEQKAEEGDRRYIRLLVLENPNHFLSTIQVGITLITILSGASLAETLELEKLHLGLEMAKLSLCRCKFSVFSIFDLYFHRFGELYPKRIALNLKDALAIRTAPVIIGLGKLVNPLFGSCLHLPIS